MGQTNGGIARAVESGSGGRVSARRRPRLGFLGAGWIGRHRMQALVQSELAEVVAIAEPDRASARAASEVAPNASLCSDLDRLLALPLDGVVIATPSALHAAQSVAALQQGMAVFCQKPLARTAAEARAVIEAAQRADRPLGVDLSYRYTQAMRRVRELVRSGELGRVYALDFVFHNAYGPDKPWFYDKGASGGGCLMDLGIHLVDLALWLVDTREVRVVDRRLFCRGELLGSGSGAVEDYASVVLDLGSGAHARIACSWHLSAGRDAVIEAAALGTRGGAAMRNVDGSFYDFVGEHYRGTQTTQVASPPDAWGGAALIDWTRGLTRGAGFDPGVRDQIRVHEILDAVYGGANAGRGDQQA